MIDYIYRVRYSDTVESIAEAFSVTPDELLSYNNITKVREGDRLIILKKPSLTHMVMPNETLNEIAVRYHKSEEDIRALNEVDRIYTGLTLVIER